MRRFLLMSVLICFSLISAKAQMADFQALYLFKFAQMTSWPQEDKGKPFVITVVGDNALSSSLRNLLKNKMVGDRKITIVEAASASGLAKSDIIFLGQAKSSQMQSLVSAHAGNKVLIVGSSKGQCAKGAGISFYPNGKSLGFEIHEGNIGKNGLRVSPNLVQLGTPVF